MIKIYTCPSRTKRLIKYKPDVVSHNKIHVTLTEKAIKCDIIIEFSWKITAVEQRVCQLECL